MSLLTSLSTATDALPNTLIGAVSEREANLTTALVVFVILSALLTVFVVLMFANKKFRAFFFRTDTDAESRPKKEKREKKPKAKKPDNASSTARREVAPRGRQKREQAASAPYLEEVPTVPLGGFSAGEDDPDIMRRTSDAYIGMAVSGSKRAPSKKQAKASDTLDKIPTVVIPQTTPQSSPKRPASSTEPAKGGRSNAKAKADAAKTEKSATAKKPSKK